MPIKSLHELEPLGQHSPAVDIVIRFQKLENAYARKALSELEKSITFPVEVDYTKTLGTLVSEGKYTQTTNGVNSEHYPPLGEGKSWLPIKLVRLTDNASNNVNVLRGLGLIPVDAHTLISLGNQYPNLQKYYLIAAYGQTHGMDNDIVVLTGDGNRRNIITVPSWGGWAGEQCVFAVIPTWQQIVLPQKARAIVDARWQ